MLWCAPGGVAILPQRHAKTRTDCGMAAPRHLGVGGKVATRRNGGWLKQRSQPDKEKG